MLEVLAWTPGTKGAVTRAARSTSSFPTQPTPERARRPISTASRASVKGAIVLVGKPRFVPVNITPPAKRRRRRATCRPQYDPNNPNAGQRGRGGRRRPADATPGAA